MLMDEIALKLVTFHGAIVGCFDDFPLEPLRPLLVGLLA